MSKSKVTYRTMTLIEIEGCKELSQCTFLPGTPHKRFAKDMGYVVTHSEEPLISAGQARQLWRLVYRYRRQIGSSDLVQHAKVQNETEVFELT
jgi:hypothetical protein